MSANKARVAGSKKKGREDSPSKSRGVLKLGDLKKKNKAKRDRSGRDRRDKSKTKGGMYANKDGYTVMPNSDDSDTESDDMIGGGDRGTYARVRSDASASDVDSDDTEDGGPGKKLKKAKKDRKTKDRDRKYFSI